MHINPISTVKTFVKRRQVFFHPVRTVNFARALLMDSRIPVERKALFLILTAGMLTLLLFPDVIEEGVLSAALPVLGTIFGIPLGAGLDWGAFAMVSVYLLKLFPDDVVNEHYLTHVLNKPLIVQQAKVTANL